MKKLFYLMAVASLFIALPLTSCSDDDDDEVTAEIPTPKTLNLTGALNVTVGGEEQPAVNQAIILTDNADGTISLTISNFSFMGFDFGNIVIENCELGEDGSFSGDATVTYDLLSLNIPLTITGTYDGSNVKFSSTFQIAELSDLEVSFTYDSSVQVTESDDQGSSFVQPEGSTAYTGTLSGTAMIVMPIGPIKNTTLYYVDGTIAVEEITVMEGITLNNVYIYYDNADEDGSFTDGTAEAYMFGMYMSFDGVSGSVVVDENDITISANLSIVIEGDEVEDDTNLPVVLNFTTVVDPYEIEEGSTTLSGSYTTDTEDTTPVNMTITTGVNGINGTVYSFDSSVTVGSTTFTGLVVVVDAEDNATVKVTTGSLFSVTKEITDGVTFTANDNGGFEVKFTYTPALGSATDVDLTFTVSTEGEE